MLQGSIALAASEFRGRFAFGRQKMSDKKIAKIYYDAHVFLTQSGELYGYVMDRDGKPRCEKLSAQQKIAFWKSRAFNNEKTELVAWFPVGNNYETRQKSEIEHRQEQRC